MDRMAHKKAFFDRLDQLDLLSDEDGNQGSEDFGRVVARSRKKKEHEIDSFVTSSHTLTSASNPKPSVSTSLAPTSSPPNLQSSVRASAANSRHGRSDSASSGDRVAAVIRSNSDGSTLDKTKTNMPSTAGKRKRTFPARVIPEHKQLFKGLHFCK